jgi:protein-tyrosine phosphatase
MVAQQTGSLAEGLVNLRDLGGMATASGAVTCAGRLLRSESPHSLTGAGLRALLDLGVATVIDLRTVSERENLPSPLTDAAGVRTLHTPIFNDGDDFPTHLTTAAEVYRWWLRERSGGIAAALAGIADAHAAPVLVHCHAGKDRTGVVVALVLRLAGVDVDAVADDYALSGVQLADMLARDRVSAVERGIDHVRAERLFTVRREAMEETMHCIDGELGGAASFIRGIGLDRARVRRLTGLLLDPTWP